MKSALIGTGMVADMHVRAVRDAAGVDLVGVYARTPERREEFARTHKLHAFGSLEDVAMSDVDFVIVATPPNNRFDVLDPLVASGKHILLEKPVGRSFSEAKAIVEMCREADVGLGIMLQHRMRPAAIELKTLLRAQHFGAITSVEISVPWWRDQAYYDAPGRGTIAQDGGGVLITQAIHTLDLALHLAGPVKRVNAMARTSSAHEMECENIVTAGLEFKNGAIGSFFATTTSYPGGPERITLQCEQAAAVLVGNTLDIHWRDGRNETIGQTSTDTGGGADPMAFTHEWHQAVIEDFVSSISEARAPIISGQEALPVHMLIDSILTSSQVGVVYDIPHV